MSDSTTGADARKPKKPSADFPLSPRNDGRWCKKLKVREGDAWAWKMFYFTGTAAEALEEYLRVKDDLIAGRDAPDKSGATSIGELVNQFLHHKKRLLESGELAPRTWKRYEATAKFLIDTFGRTRPAASLRPTDFQDLRASMAAKWGPVALGNEIQIVRSIFRYGLKSELLEREARFGAEFNKPTAKTIRKARNQRGEQLFAADQLRTLLAKASPNLKAMILLAINGGLGNTDVAELTAAHHDLDCGWLNYPRPKTDTPRRAPLWPETVAAIRTALEKRREPKGLADAKLLFIGPRGESYVGDHKGYRVTAEFSRLLKVCKIDGRSFYDLRRTFQTEGYNRTRDKDAVRAIMGHVAEAGDMTSIYQQRTDDARLLAVTEAVRGWIFQKPEKGDGKGVSTKVGAKAKSKPRRAKSAPRREEPAAEAFALRIVG